MEYCSLCNNGTCVLGIKDYPKWANVAACQKLIERNNKGMQNIYINEKS